MHAFQFFKMQIRDILHRIKRVIMCQNRIHCLDNAPWFKGVYHQADREQGASLFKICMNVFKCIFLTHLYVDVLVVLCISVDGV